MKLNSALGSAKIMALAAIIALPSLAEAHPGLGAHTHSVTSILSDAQVVGVIIVAVGFVAIASWRAFRSRTK